MGQCISREEKSQSDEIGSHQTDLSIATPNNDNNPPTIANDSNITTKSSPASPTITTNPQTTSQSSSRVDQITLRLKKKFRSRQEFGSLRKPFKGSDSSDTYSPSNSNSQNSTNNGNNNNHNNNNSQNNSHHHHHFTSDEAKRVLRGAASKAANNFKFGKKKYHRYCSNDEGSSSTDTTKVIITKDADGNKSINQYMLIRDLGVGSYATVKLVINLEEDQFYAMKIFKRKQLMKKKFGLKKATPYDDVKREISILKRLEHPNIIKLYEVIDDPSEDKFYLVMEYAEGGSIMKGELEAEPLSPTRARQYFIQIVSGLEYLHQKNIIHRDIKPENLLLDSHDNAKISDFSVAMILSCNPEEDDILLKKTVGTPAFLPPELCAQDTAKIIGTAIDIWCLGVSLYFFVFGKLPFTGENEMMLYDNIRTQELTFPTSSDPDLEDLLQQLLAKEPEARITMGGIKQHPWVTSLGDSFTARRNSNPNPNSNSNSNDTTTTTNTNNNNNTTTSTATTTTAITTTTNRSAESKPLPDIPPKKPLLKGKLSSSDSNNNSSNNNNNNNNNHGRANRISTAYQKVVSKKPLFRLPLDEVTKG